MKECPWDLVIFDLDGTLLDTIDDLGHAVNHSLALAGYPQHTMAEYRQMVGNGVRNLVTRALPEDLRTETEIDARLEDFLSYYKSHIDVHTHPYEGMAGLVRDLHEAGAAVAVASNKFQEGTERLVAEFFPGIPFCAVLGNRPGTPLKPDTAVVRTCIEASGLSGDARVVMVGDSAVDMKTAANAGIHSIGVTWGFRGRDELAASGACEIVDTADALRCCLYR